MTKTCKCGITWEKKDWVYLGDQAFDEGITLSMYNFPCKNTQCRSTFTIRK